MQFVWVPVELQGTQVTFILLLVSLLTIPVRHPCISVAFLLADVHHPGFLAFSGNVSFPEAHRLIFDVPGRTAQESRHGRSSTRSNACCHASAPPPANTTCSFKVVVFNALQCFQESLPLLSIVAMLLHSMRPKIVEHRRCAIAAHQLEQGLQEPNSIAIIIRPAIEPIA